MKKARKTEETGRADIYARITDRFVVDLEQGVRPWMKPWSAAHTSGRITRPLRHNGTPYSVFNIEQIDGLPEHYYHTLAPVLDLVDRIQMPPFESFRDAESYYGTLSHELGFIASVLLASATSAGRA